MMRIAKMADDDGGVEGGALDAGAAASAESGTDGAESRTGRGGGGGSLRGRGGEAIGRSAFALAFPTPASLSEIAGSEGIRALSEALASPASGIEGLERRRIGGG
jgi:hypothetical protein